MIEDARRIAEHAARSSYGRLLAIVAARTRDITVAEDALADALTAALETWPLQGVPQNPDAWLITVARRKFGHSQSKAATARVNLATLAILEEERAQHGDTPYGDARIALMFVCAHPAIDESVQAPLILQTVLGLESSRIAGSFLVSPAAMSQKLVRAKAKIRDAGIRFSIPEPNQAEGRVQALLAAIYAAYGTGWEDVLGTEEKTRGLAQEAIWLGRLLAGFIPNNAECLGLLSLMLHCESRRAARRDTSGRFVPLDHQDTQLWDAGMMVEAEGLLRSAAQLKKVGRFQLEAAIQSLHAQTVLTAKPNPNALMRLYDLLVTTAPSVGAEVARACAYVEGGEVEGALVLLNAISTRCQGYQPWWAANARALYKLDRVDEAAAAARIAAGLTSDKAVRDYLLNGGIFT